MPRVFLKSKGFTEDYDFFSACISFIKLAYAFASFPPMPRGLLLLISLEYWPLVKNSVSSIVDERH